MTEFAKKFAIAAHGGQKYGELPYAHHLEAVSVIVKEFGAPSSVCEAAWLHDVLEDTSTTYEELEEKFGTKVAELVEAVSNKPGANRAEKAAATYPVLRKAGKWAVLLKLCDRVANVRAAKESAPGLFAMYLKEFPAFHKWLYKPGEHEPLWAELSALLEGES